MPRNWSSLAQSSNGIYTENDFKQAFYQLVCAQVLYARELHHAVAYALIARYRAEFDEAADLLGLQLKYNDSYRYCYVVPYAVKHQQLDTTETLLMLVLRRLYHDRALSGDLDSGETVVTVDELVAAYQASTQRELPKTAGDLRELILRMRRYGIAKPGKPAEGDAQPFTVVILPGINEILSESAISRLGAYQQAGVAADALDTSTTNTTTRDEADETP